MIRHFVAALMTMGLLAMGLRAQQPTAKTLVGIVGQSTADRAVDGGLSSIQVQASTDDSNAMVKAARTRSFTDPDDPTRALSTSWSLTASAPLSKGGDATALLSGDGFPDSFTLKTKYTRYLLSGRRRPDFDNPDVVKKRDVICEELILGAIKKGVSPEDAKGLECDTGNVKKFIPERLEDHNALFWDDDRSHYLWGGSATVGHRQFKYLETDLTEKSTSKTPWGVSVFGATVPRGMDTLLTGGFEYRSKQKDADEKTLCPQTAGASQLECKTGPIGAPVDADEQLVYVEMRRLMLSRAMSLKVTYNFETEKLGLDLPVYVIPSSDSGLAGGIRVGWLETEGAQIGVFVTSSFKLFPN